MRAVLLLAAVLSTVSCAGRLGATGTPSRDASRVVAVDASALIAHGCFSCLEEAFAKTAGNNSPQALEAAVLLTLRAKELGLPSEPWLARAQELAGRVPGMRYAADVAAMIPSDPLGGDRERALAENVAGRGGGRALPAWREIVERSPGTPAFRAYLDLALVCAYDGPQRQMAITRALEMSARVPLLRYRAGICHADAKGELAGLEDEGIAFVDADYARARYAMEDRDRPDTDEALRRLQRAAEAFPQSAAIATTIGNLRQAREEWAEALPAFDAAIALVPTHHDAWLGRVITLSNLLRHDDAIVAASHLIELGNWFHGQAYYWRAWNEFSLRDSTTARADADRAKGQMANAPLFFLSGLIEWREQRLDTAIHEFEEALKMDFGLCEAAQSLGGAHAQHGDRDGARSAFQQARQCFDLAIAVRREYVTKVMAGAESPATKARLVATQERGITDATARRDDVVRALGELQKRAAVTP